MDATTFATACYEEKERQLSEYMNGSDSVVGALRIQLNLSETQTEMLRKLLDCALTDTFITLLYALDGEAALGNIEQQQFKLFSEDGTVISACGELEAAAYEAFYEV